jgi:hypothetical protein
MADTYHVISLTRGEKGIPTAELENLLNSASEDGYLWHEVIPMADAAVIVMRRSGAR